MTEETWGPWVEHTIDGKPPGIVGKFVHAVGSEGREDMAFVTANIPGQYTQFHRSACIKYGYEYVVRYRIRKPSALIQLEQIAQDVTPKETVQ